MDRNPGLQDGVPRTSVCAYARRRDAHALGVRDGTVDAAKQGDKDSAGDVGAPPQGRAGSRGVHAMTDR